MSPMALLGLLKGGKSTVAIVATIVALGAVWLAWGHYEGLVAERDELRSAYALSEQAHAETAANFTSFAREATDNMQRLQASLDEMSRKFAAAEGRVDDLRETLQRHDLGRLARHKPGLVGRRINAATGRVWDDIAEATGADVGADAPAEAGLPAP